MTEYFAYFALENIRKIYCADKNLDLVEHEFHQSTNSI